MPDATITNTPDNKDTRVNTLYLNDSSLKKTRTTKIYPWLLCSSKLSEIRKNSSSKRILK